MEPLSEEAIHEIAQLHSRWIQSEIAGDPQACLRLCAEDIELWPPDQRPAIGRATVAEKLSVGGAKIHAVDISGRRIRGSGDIAFLTANFRTTFSTADDLTPRQILGSHLWILQKRSDTWLVTLVSWSLWEAH
jgi:ketosteroid isomerase-like protein